MKAEGVRQRRLASRRPRLGQAVRACEELPVFFFLDNRSQGHRGVKDCGGQVCQGFEIILRIAVNDLNLRQ